MASVCITNHIVEIVVVQKRSQYLHDFKRISKYEYVDTRTGEVKTYFDHEHPNKNRSFTTLRRYINMNFTDKDNELFITLTYANQETDRSKISRDFKNFWKKFKYHHRSCEYIAVYEPHKTGAWHIHILVKDLKKKYFYVEKSDVQKLWKHGFVKVVKLKGNDNIGAYLSAISSGEKSDSETNKGSRVSFYPKYAKCFSHSKNIKKPIYKRMTYEQALELVEHSKQSYKNTIGIFENGEEVNTIYYQQFNAKRKENHHE